MHRFFFGGAERLEALTVTPPAVLGAPPSSFSATLSKMSFTNIKKDFSTLLPSLAEASRKGKWNWSANS